MRKDALEMNVKGIKCDNKDCNYNNMEVEFKEYKEWLNKPCPICGCNLLTEKDYKTTVTMMNMVNILNKILPKRHENEEIVTMNIDMDGTGKVELIPEK